MEGCEWEGKGRAKDSLLTTLFNTFPLVDIFKNVGLMERIEHLKKGYVIGPKSLTMFRLGWTALFLFVATIITIKAIPELDSFIGKITENFTNKIQI